jgi:hypothetical protein
VHVVNDAALDEMDGLRRATLKIEGLLCSL